MTETPVVITSLALRLPGARSADELWELLREGRCQIAPVSPERRALTGWSDWEDPIGEVSGIDRFDHEFFDIPAEEAALLDPQQRLLLEVAHEAVTAAGLVEAGGTEPRRSAVVMALATNSYFGLLCERLGRRGEEVLQPRTIVDIMNSGVASRISHEYNLTGPVYAMDTACSSFLAALVQGMTAIRHEGCESAVIGGANLLSAPYTTMFCRSAGITTPGGRARVFDAEADGTVIGEGVVVAVLEREDLARERGRTILARVAGAAITNDGSSLSIMAPNPRGQAEVIRRCYTDGAGGVDPRRVGCIEAHGTGTRIGDPVEVRALSGVFHREELLGRSVALGSVKSNIGHLLAAAGGAGLAKLVLSLRHRAVPATLHVSTVNPLLQLQRTPFEVATEERDWPAPPQGARLGAVTSLGLGGTNAHVVLEEVEEGPRTVSERSAGGETSLCLSARDPAALERMIEALPPLLADPRWALSDIAHTLNRFRSAERWRARVRIDRSRREMTTVERAEIGRRVRRVLLDPDHAAAPEAETLRALLGPALRPRTADPRPGELSVSLSAAPAGERGLSIAPGTDPVGIAAALFLQGCSVRWHVVHPDGSGVVLPIVPYPFAGPSHWIPVERRNP
ncbi:polyketide synthase [Brachybacterium squillarum]|uniref:polyketide synthase n=1 Tax=Brachybacterium squillarum TaxID=661979 RepID=UPI00026299A8|nr:polyketide synthase [Brachybacterium squillarum]